MVLLVQIYLVSTVVDSMNSIIVTVNSILRHTYIITLRFVPREPWPATSPIEGENALIGGEL